MQTDIDLAFWLADARAELDLTQAQLAKRLGVSTNTVARWERAELPITKITQIALNAVFKERKATKLKESKEIFGISDSPDIDAKRLRQLRQLCHPDNHGSSKLSNDVMAWLNQMKS